MTVEKQTLCKNENIEELTLKEIRDTIKDYLSVEGFRPDFDDDNDLIFKYKKTSVSVIVRENDLNYIRMITGGKIDFSNNDVKKKAQVAVNKINIDWKIVKARLTDKSLQIEASIFVRTIDEFFAFFTRLINILIDAFIECVGLIFGDK